MLSERYFRYFIPIAAAVANQANKNQIDKRSLRKTTANRAYKYITKVINQCNI